MGDVLGLSVPWTAMVGEAVEMDGDEVENGCVGRVACRLKKSFGFVRMDRNCSKKSQLTTMRKRRDALSRGHPEGVETVILAVAFPARYANRLRLGLGRN